jgi:hypothetical protein
VAGEDERRVPVGDQLERAEVAAQGIGVEAALERDRRRDARQEVVPREQEAVGG